MSDSIPDCSINEHLKPIYNYVTASEKFETELFSEHEFAFLYEVMQYDDVLLYVRIVKKQTDIIYMCDLKNLDPQIDVEDLLDFLLGLIEAHNLENRLKTVKYVDTNGNEITAIGCQVQLHDNELDNLDEYHEVMIDIEDFMGDIGEDWVRRHLRSQPNHSNDNHLGGK